MDKLEIKKQENIGAINTVCSQSLEAFGTYFFPHHLSLAVPDFHKEIYSVYENELIRKIAIGAPRGHSKTTMTDLVYLLWAICYKKASFVLLISDTYSQAVLFMEAVKAEIETNEKLRLFFGDLKSDKWSEGEIITGNGIMVKALGSGMKVRGLKFRENRPDLVICDDMENEELVESKERREKQERWLNGTLIPAMAKNGRLVIIGTILHYDSMLYKLLDKEKYTDFYKKIYQAIQANGTALWPEHLNVKELEKIKQDYVLIGQGYIFYQEYQNDPVSDENRKFKIEKMEYYEEDDIKGRTLNHFMAIDRAYSLEKTADFTGIVVVAVDMENVWWIRLAMRFKGEEAELIQKIFDLKNHFKLVASGIEQKAYQYTIKPALDKAMRERNDFIDIAELKDAGQNKNKRIEGLLPRYETGSIKFKKDQTDLIDELIRFPRSPFDDLSDALAYINELAYTPVMQENRIHTKKPSNYA